MSSMAREVAGMLTGRHVRDVLVPGWIDRDDAVPEFRPQPLVVWLRLDEGLVRFASEGQYDHLTALRVTAADWSDVGLLAEAEDEVVLASYGEQLFGDGRDEWGCTAVRAYLSGTGRAGGTGTPAPVIRGLALDFAGGHSLFLDPAWTFGIRLGNRADEADWVAKYGGDSVLQSLRPAVPVHEQTPHP
ncbi:hypothetical protein ACF08N_08180 [Streptomyces sp. NPDC015127]|uniref:hypothetical protein n=1 Tax=Streptomyces sp. NPDC015127 TaxID=3364939 RepID=UPI0036FD8B4C